MIIKSFNAKSNQSALHVEHPQLGH